MLRTVPGPEEALSVSSSYAPGKNRLPQVTDSQGTGIQDASDGSIFADSAEPGILPVP